MPTNEAVPMVKLAQDLCSRSRQKRELALRKVRSLSDSDRTAVIEWLLVECEKLLAEEVVALFVFCVIVMALGIVTYYSYLLAGCLLAFVGLCITRLVWLSAGHAQDSLKLLIAEFASPALLPCFLNQPIYEGSVSETRHKRLRRKLLVQLLPLAQNSDMTALTPSQMKTLTNFLKTPLVDIDLAVCILQTAERTREVRLLNCASKLSGENTANFMMNVPLDRTAIGFNKKVEAIRSAANACLPGDTLLRASSAPVTAPDELLRAAVAAESESPPEQLLRPHQL